MFTPERMHQINVLIFESELDEVAREIVRLGILHLVRLDDQEPWAENLKSFEAGAVRSKIEYLRSRLALLMKKEEDLSKLYLLEIILWSYLVSEAKKTLGGFPFTIGTVLSYLILKRTEIRNLITILNGKLLNMEKADIESHLRAAF